MNIYDVQNYTLWFETKLQNSSAALEDWCSIRNINKAAGKGKGLTVVT